MAEALRFAIRAPDACVVERLVDSVRFPAPSGQVGMRRGAEPFVTEVVSGLVLMRARDEVSFAGTAGGLLEHTSEGCTLFTPFAVVGSEEEVLDALERIRADPDSELAARRALGELERRIVNELGRERPRGAREANRVSQT